MTPELAGFLVAAALVGSGIGVIAAMLLNARRQRWDGHRGDVVSPTRADRKSRFQRRSR